MLGFLLKSLVAASIGYLVWLWFTVPLPKGLQRPILARILLVIMAIQHLYYSVIMQLGLTDMKTLFRQAFDEVKKRTKKTAQKYYNITDTTFSGVKVRLYIPKVSRSEGHRGLVYIHGGGWCSAHAEAYDDFIGRVSRDVSMVVASVGYRLAPEVVFPGALDDCVEATKYFVKHAREFGVDPERVAVAGDSAGGNLAAATCLKLRDDKFSPVIKHQLMIYPCLQALDMCTPSMIQNNVGPMLTRREMARYWCWYITGSDKLVNIFLRNGHTSPRVKQTIYKREISHSMLGEEFKYPPYRSPTEGDADSDIWRGLEDKLLNPYLCPLVAKDLRHLPSTYIFTCQYDVLRDEGIMYAQRLARAGVKVVHSNMLSGFHAVALIAVFPESDMLCKEFSDYLKSNL